MKINRDKSWGEGGGRGEVANTSMTVVSSCISATIIQAVPREGVSCSGPGGEVGVGICLDMSII